MTIELDSPEVQLAHRWQDFRLRCITLAIKSGATSDMIEVADKIGTYILTKSATELAVNKVESDEA